MVAVLRVINLILAEHLCLVSQVKNNKKFARSLFVCEHVKKGEIITKENIRSIRPGYGLHPKYYYEILGKVFSVNVGMGEPLSLEMIKK